MRQQRFDWILNCDKAGPRREFDHDLLTGGPAALTPTVGSLTPGWTLLVPRRKALSVAALPAQDRKAVLALLPQIERGLSGFDGRFFTFEHGAAEAGSLTGCGVDQAHLHCARFDFDLIACSMNGDKSIRWREIDIADPYATINKDRDYYFMADGARAFVAYPNLKISQFFRRVIAHALGRAEEWDYRAYPGAHNARLTVDGFESGPRGPKRIAA